MPAVHIELLEKAKVVYGQAEQLLLNPHCSAEDLDKADKLTAEADTLKAKASRLQKLELAKNDPSLPQHVHTDVPSEFKDWEDFVGAYTASLKANKVVDSRLQRFERKDMTGQIGASGGILIPTTQLSEIMAVSAPLSIVRSLATKINMSSRVINYPMLNQTGTTAGAATFFGGVSVKWQEEGAAATTSDATFREGELHARELVGSTRVGNSLLNDVSALASFLGGPRGFPGAVAWAEDYAFLRGDGINKPLGVLNAPVTKITTRNTPGSVEFEDLTRMVASHMGDNPVWTASISLKDKLLSMKGPTSYPSYLWGNAITGTPSTLMGYPIKWTDKQPAVGVQGDLMLSDFSYYLVATLQEGTTLDSSSQELFSSNMTTFRIIHRVDGKPWLSAVITLSDGSTTVTPFVALAA